MSKELTDCDLDVMNAMKDFPCGDSDAFLYVRGGINKLTGKTNVPFVAMAGTFNSTVAAIIPLLHGNPFLRDSILTAVLNYFDTDMVMAREFVKNVKTSKLIL